MPAVATESAVITCFDAGTVAASASQSVLTVDGVPVLLAKDLDETGIEKCGALAPQTKCTKTKPATAGVAARLTVRGEPVLLAGATGPTDAGRVWLMPSPGQSKLVAE